MKKITYSIINSLELVDKDYDLIINTRFDLYFTKYLNHWSINYNNLNLAFKDLEANWQRQRKTSDLIYIFPKNYKNILISALKKSENLYAHGPGHFIYDYLNINDN